MQALMGTLRERTTLKKLSEQDASTTPYSPSSKAQWLRLQI
jgi:hypothetical protein